MTLLLEAARVARKELLIEWRHRARLVGLFFFALAILLLFAFSVPETPLLRQLAGGSLWLGILLASARSLDQSFHVELEHGALEGMVLAPVRPAAIFLGKAAANAILLVSVGACLAPLVIALYDPPTRGAPWVLAALLTLGCTGLAAPGTIVAGITAQARGASHLLPMLYLPTVVPVLLAAGRATAVWFEGDPMDQADDWMLLLLAFNAIFWPLGAILFARVVEPRG